MRKSKHYCSSCRHWIPGNLWESTYHPHFAVISNGVCKGTGKERLNSQRACRFFEQNTNIQGSFSLIKLQNEV
jgi:hypothetical protein